MEVGMLIALSITCLTFIILYIGARSKVGKQDIRYVDTSGIASNPPKFIETWKNKTINFDLGKHSLKICHLPILENLDTISKLAGHFSVLKYGVEKSYDRPFSKTDAIRTYQIHYLKAVDLLYKLGKPFSKWGFKRAFYKKAKEDSNFILGISAEIFDYWQNMGKLLGVLSKGMTPRLTYGENLGSDKLKWDDQGKRSITPRYDFIPRSRQKRTTEPEKKTSE